MTTKHWFGDYVFEVENFMLDDRCARLIAHTEEIGFAEATINTAVGHVVKRYVRNNDRVISDDAGLLGRAVNVLGHEDRRRTCLAAKCLL